MACTRVLEPGAGGEASRGDDVRRFAAARRQCSVDRGRSRGPRSQRTAPPLARSFGRRAARPSPPLAADEGCWPIGSSLTLLAVSTNRSSGFFAPRRTMMPPLLWPARASNARGRRSEGRRLARARMEGEARAMRRPVRGPRHTLVSRSPVSAARVVCDSHPVASVRSTMPAPSARRSRLITNASLLPSRGATACVLRPTSSGLPLVFASERGCGCAVSPGSSASSDPSSTAMAFRPVAVSLSAYACPSSPRLQIGVPAFALISRAKPSFTSLALTLLHRCALQPLGRS